MQCDQICPGPQICSSMGLTVSFDNVGFAVALPGTQASLYIHQVPFCRIESLALYQEGQALRPALPGEGPSGRLI